MTEQELIDIEEILQANFQFLDFSNDVLHDLWFDSLKKYDVIEVKAGVKAYIENESKTPTMNDILEYIRPIRKKNIEEHEHNLQVLWANSVRCPDCNDNGYVIILYPSGYEKLKPCDCEVGHHMFGEKYWKDREGYEMPRWEKAMLFKTDEKNVDREMQRYKLVTIKPFSPKGVICKKWEEVKNA